MYANKLEFHGPFFSQDKSKALLEVYDHADTVSIQFIIFSKRENVWTLVGNVRF